MNDNLNINLVEGSFTPEEAKSILVELIDFKINFHKIKCLRSEERQGCKDETSEARITHLRNEKEQLLKVLDEAQKAGNHITVDSCITVQAGVGIKTTTIEN